LIKAVKWKINYQFKKYFVKIKTQIPWLLGWKTKAVKEYFQGVTNRMSPFSTFQ
jgi:hypothetical protein